MGLADYRRISVGFSSHSVLQVPEGRFIIITALEVEPWLSVIDSGLAVDNVNYYANGFDQSVYIQRQQEIESRADYQMRVLADTSSSHSFTLRPTIKYDSNYFEGADQKYYLIRSLECPARRFETLIFAKQTCLIMHSLLGKQPDTMGTDVQPYSDTYNKDKLPFYGMLNTTDQVNYAMTLLQGPPADVYVPFTKADTITTPGSWVPGQTSLEDTLIYPLGQGQNPVYNGNASALESAVFHNLPIINIEYVMVKAGTSTQQGWFSPEILKALGWA